MDLAVGGSVGPAAGDVVVVDFIHVPVVVVVVGPAKVIS